jgi:putative ABC transport system permease protein
MWKDLQFGFRLLVKAPGHTVIVVLTLALGIGLTTAMFSIAYGTFLRGLPFPEADRIMRVELNNLVAGDDHIKVGPRDFLAWTENQSSFEGLAAWYGISVNVSGSGSLAEPYNCAYGTANLFDLLRVHPLLGRGFRAEDVAAGAPPTVIISEAMWRRRFGADPKVLGKTLRVDGNEKTIVGIMPPGFRFPLNHYLWLPLRIDPNFSPSEQDHFEVFGRLKARVSRRRALADLATREARLDLELPTTHKGVGVAMTPYVNAYVDSKMRSAHYLMLGAVFGVLLIACANVGNLLLVRGLYRAQEFAVRMALGASRSRLIAQLASEAALLALVGGVLGLAVAQTAISLYLHAMGDEIPAFWVDVHLDRGVLLFALGVTLLVSLLTGLVPALQGVRTPPGDILKDQSRGSGGRRLGQINTAFVVAEITLSCALLVATGLMLESVVKLKSINFGFKPEAVIAGQISLYGPQYSDSKNQLRYLEMVQDRLQWLPEVKSVAFASALPGFFRQTSWFGLEGTAYATDASYPETSWIVVSPRYFDIFGLRILKGRSFTPADREGSEPVVIINRSFAKRYLSGQDPLGKRLRLGRSDSSRPWMTIVGIVPDLSMDGIGSDGDIPETIYLPLGQKTRSWMKLIVQARGGPSDLIAKIRQEGATVDPDIPIFAVGSMAEDLADVTRSFTRSGTLFTVFGIMALGLTVLGLYGVMAFSVSRRTKEVGIRVALGARPGNVRRMILMGGLARLGLGLVFGLALAAAFVRTLRALLFHVSPWDPAVFSLIPLLLLACGLIACLVPSQRAARVDPAVALRSE